MTDEEFRQAMETIQRITAKFMARWLAIKFYEDCPVEEWNSLERDYINTAMKFKTREEALADVRSIERYVECRLSRRTSPEAEHGRRLVEGAAV